MIDSISAELGVSAIEFFPLSSMQMYATTRTATIEYARIRATPDDPDHGETAEFHTLTLAQRTRPR